MNKTNNMNLWSIGLGSTLLMIMLAGSQNALGGQANALDSARSGASGYTLQVVQESRANGYGNGNGLSSGTGTSGNTTPAKSIHHADAANKAQRGITGNDPGNTDKLLAQVLTMVSDT